MSCWYECQKAIAVLLADRLRNSLVEQRKRRSRQLDLIGLSIAFASLVEPLSIN
ncbi:MAG: hypothetical protein WCD18_21890 [Thermosynechococcaceae cyanobacterium]